MREGSRDKSVRHKYESCELIANLFDLPIFSIVGGDNSVIFNKKEMCKFVRCAKSCPSSFSCSSWQEDLR